MKTLDTLPDLIRIAQALRIRAGHLADDLKHADQPSAAAAAKKAVAFALDAELQLQKVGKRIIQQERRGEN